MTAPIDAAERNRIRSQFPALSGPTVLLENAGGSQVPEVVADRIRDYMLSTYVQLGAGYELSERATAVVDDAHRMVRTVMNGHEGEVILGPSSSALLAMLARCYGQVLEPGREIVVAESGHEANIGPWKRLESRGFPLRWWNVDSATHCCPVERLAALLTERTALVAFPHVSNLLGGIVDVAEVTSQAHAVGAKVVVDGVAFAPHRAIDVEAWGVDWYVYSAYKVYGPHVAAMWGRQDALADLPRPNHFFIADDDLPYAFELGGVNHEACAGLLGLADYLRFLTGDGDDVPLQRSTVERAFDLMTACELPLQQRLVDFLDQRANVRIIGPGRGDDRRVGTVSFVHRNLSSRHIADAVNREGIGIRNGHMYAYHLCRAIGLDPDDGVVRISLVHYNTPDEIERLIEVLDRVL